MKNRLKTASFFLLGCLLTLVFIYTPAKAASVEKPLNALFNNIKIYVNGDLITPQDAQGNVIEPFIVDGTTYLPVRALAEALGQDVNWDPGSYSVYIGEKPGEEIAEVRVKTSQELIDAIAPNTKIIMEPGLYDISEVKINTPYISAAEVFDGTELIISNVYNLTIEGAGADKTEIVTPYSYANVLNFSSCNNIVLKGLKAGHAVEKGNCVGGVFNIKHVNGMDIIDSYLYGCGTEGLTIMDSSYFNFINSTIADCTYGIMTINNSNRMAFVQSTFTGNRGFDMITVMYSRQVSFEDCIISENDNATDNLATYGYYALLRNHGNVDNVLYKNCVFENNHAGWFGDQYEATFENCVYKNNVIDYDKSPF